MIQDIRFLHVRDFLRTNVAGVVDLAASRTLLKELVATCVAHGHHHVLIDTREAIGKGTASDVYKLASELHDLGVSPKTRIAILNYPKDDFDRAAFLEICAANRGYTIHAFRDFEAAMMWLTTGNAPEDSSR